jgi:hypothetical protein
MNPARRIVIISEIGVGIVRNYHDRTSKIAKKLLRVRFFYFLKNLFWVTTKSGAKKIPPLGGGFLYSGWNSGQALSLRRFRLLVNRWLAA